MLRMLTDIIAPDKGEIRLFDNNTPGVAMASKIGYLPEERGLYLKMKIREILLFFGLLRGMNRHDAKRSIDYWIDRLNLGRYNDSQMQELSRGLQQKVQFITALIHSPDLVILDEPWTGLDAINVQIRICLIIFHYIEKQSRSFRSKYLFATSRHHQHLKFSLPKAVAV